MTNIEVESDLSKDTQCFHIVQAVMKVACKLSMKTETAVSIEYFSHS